jgi:hypothetical protein
MPPTPAAFTGGMGAAAAGGVIGVIGVGAGTEW